MYSFTPRMTRFKSADRFVFFYVSSSLFEEYIYFGILLRRIQLKLTYSTSTLHEKLGTNITAEIGFCNIHRTQYYIVIPLHVVSLLLHFLPTKPDQKPFDYNRFAMMSFCLTEPSRPLQSRFYFPFML